MSYSWKADIGEVSGCAEFEHLKGRAITCREATYGLTTGGIIC